MAIFAGLDNIILFFILFVLIYCTNDSLIAQLLLFGFTTYSAMLFVPTIATENDGRFLIFFGILIVFTLGNIYMWMDAFVQSRKSNNNEVM